MCKILQSLFLLLKEIFAVICSWKSSMCEPSTGLHFVVFIELIKLHSLEIKELILIIFLKENNLWPSFVSSLFSFQFIPDTEQQLLGFSLHFQRKNSFNLTSTVKYFSAGVTALTSHFWRQFSWPEWFQISFILQL